MTYRVVRSQRKTLALEVRPDGEILVRAPYGLKEDVIARFVRERQTWLRDATARQTARLAAHPEPSDAEIVALRALAKQTLPELVARYAPLVGAEPTHITVTSARTRFGSCSGKNAISFSWRLMRYPQTAIEYVVVHELCHILHHNHSRAFYDCVERVLPDWRTRRARLRG